MGSGWNVNGGTLALPSGGLLLSTTVQSGGTLEVLSGAHVSATTVSNSGTFLVFSGGTADPTRVLSGGTEIIASGGVDDGAQISGGVLVVQLGGSATNTNVRGGGTEAVQSGAIVTGVISSGGAFELMGTKQGARPWDGPSTVYCVAEPYCPPGMAKSMSAEPRTARHPSERCRTTGAAPAQARPGAAVTVRVHVRARRALHDGGMAQVGGAHPVRLATQIDASHPPAGSKVRRRNRPCLGRPGARILLGPFPHLRGVPSPHLGGTHLHSPRTHLHISADPLFPATLVSQGSNDHFAASGIARAHWASADAVRKIFREAFEGI